MRIVLIEDNIELARAITYHLQGFGHAVDHLSDGVLADQFLHLEGADLVILDINLPGMSGLEILNRLRARECATPVLLLTARGDVSDRVAGLDAGADDYLVKPFEMTELGARLRALARRRPELAEQHVRIGGMIYEPGARVLRVDGAEEQVSLPRRELAVFECLLEHRDRIVSKAQLLDQVYGVGADADEKVVEVYVSRLRKRVSPFGVEIRGARGLGYMLYETGKA